MDNSDSTGNVNILIGQQNIIPGAIKTRHLSKDTSISQGDLYYGDGNSNFKRLAPGELGQYLQTQGEGADLVWATISIPTIATDGWTSASSQTWTYASSTTFTISGDQTTIFTKGTRLKFTQTSIKYFVVVSSSYSDPNTTVTVTGGTDYSIANASISENYYSYQVNPQGYPGTFNYTSTITAETGSITTATGVGKFRVLGKTCFVTIKINVTDAGTGANALEASIPISADSAVSYAAYAFKSDDGTAVSGFVDTITTIKLKKYNNTFPGATGSSLYAYSTYDF